MTFFPCRMLRDALRRLYRELIPLLYGRTNYKLFLQRSFESLDRRVAAILCSTNVLPALVKPVPIKAPFGRSMLVVAPHQDDEIIGCGGAMLLQRAAGRSVAVVFAQDGGDEHAADGRSRDEQIAIREAEATRVTEAMGNPPPRFLRYVHLTGREMEAAAGDLQREIERTRADVVFTPFFLDHNIHHQLTNFALAEALAQTDLEPRIFGYEVWGLTVPNVILRIDEVQEEKSRLLRYYESQLSGKDYVHGTMGLNMYHSLHFGAGECRFAERYFEMPAEEFIRVVRAIRQEVGGESGLFPLVF
ncbi:PIG-L deacetylase family protein [Gemmatimonadota bacterium]